MHTSLPPCPTPASTHAVAAMDNFLTRRMNALEQQRSCFAIIVRAHYTEIDYVGSSVHRKHRAYQKRLTWHDQYLEQNHTFFNIFEENSKLKNEIRQLEKILEEQV